MNEAPPAPAPGFEPHGFEFGLPLVSIVVVNYNYARFVGAAIESIFAQTYPNIECVVLDNRSTDDSLAVLAELVRRFPALRVVERAANAGQAVASVEGFAMTRGPYVVLFDADDVMLPEFVATHVATHLSLRIPVGFSCSDMFQTLGTGLVLGTFAPLNDYVRSGKGRRDDLVRPVDTTEPALPLAVLPAVEPARVHYVARRQSDWAWASMSAFLFRRDALDLVMRCDALKGLMTNFDVFVTRGLNVLTGSVVIDRTLTVYRMHESNVFVRHPQLDGCFNFARGGRYDEEQTARRMLIDHCLDSLPELSEKLQDRRRLLDAIRTINDVNPALRATAARGSYAASAFLRRLPMLRRLLARGELAIWAIALRVSPLRLGARF